MLINSNKPIKIYPDLETQIRILIGLLGSTGSWDIQHGLIVQKSRDTNILIHSYVSMLGTTSEICELTFFFAFAVCLVNLL